MATALLPAKETNRGHRCCVVTWLAVMFALLATILWISSTGLYELAETSGALEDGTEHRFDVDTTAEKQVQLNRLVGGYCRARLLGY